MSKNKMSSKKKLILGVAAALGAITLMIQLYGWAAGRKQLKLYGNVDIRAVDLGFRVAGKLNHLRFEEGDRVKKGDLMASLDKEPFEKERAINEAAWSEGKANLIGARKEYERQKVLLERTVSTKQAFDNAEEAFNAAVAKEAEAKARVDQSVLNLQDADLIAPEEGTILTRIREPGSILAIGAPVYTLSLEHPVWVRAYVDEPNLGTVHTGQSAIVLTDGGDEYQGTVGFISPQAEFTPKTVETGELRTSLVYRLRIVVENPNLRLKQGMPVTVLIKK